MVHTLRYSCIIFTFVLLLPVTAPRAAGPDANELSFLDGLSLVVVDTEDISALHLARQMVQAYGGRVAIMSPPSILIGWVPFESRDELIGKAGIKEIYYGEVRPEELKTSDPGSGAMIHFFNAAVRGDLAAEYRDFAQTVSPDQPTAPREPDVREPITIDQDAYMENLRSAGLNLDALAEDGLLFDLSSPATMGNSDYMTGTVALTVFFVESDGTGADPDLYTWSAESMQRYLDGVSTALTWWSNQANLRGDCWVTFLINYYSGADPRCQQWSEPILHDPGTYENVWVNAIMTKFGYTSGTRWDRVYAFNTWQRSYYQTNRSYSAFVPYNPPPAPAEFPGGDTAYAYWYGPYTVLLYRVQGWTTAQVFAHESGHIFGACDEYAGGCSSCTSTCTNGTPNANCEVCNPETRDCMMKANSYSLCGYSAKHVGWEVLNPCAPAQPPLLPAPSISSVSPAYGYQGLTTAITVTGGSFYAGVKLDLGSDVFVHTTTLVSQTRIDANVEVLGAAPPGLRDLRVINRDGRSAARTGAFEVRTTTRHYYSPTGGNDYPFVTPPSAAASLQDAIDAAYDGDTVFVVSRTFDNFSIIVQKGVLLHGGWNSTFTERNIDTGKTALNLNGNVTFLSSGGAAGLDGFVLQNGTGAYDVVPFAAYFGGAVRFVGGTAVLANCDIHSSRAGGTMDFGVGGAIFGDGCTVDMRNNFIHNNTATQGAGIYLRGCSGSVAGNTVSNNSPNSSSEPRLGSGIALFGSSNVTLADNVVTVNTQASEGGGFYVADSFGITVTGGALGGNTVSFSGAAALFKNSTGLIDGIDVAGNSSGAIAGGLALTDGSSFTVTNVSFLSNAALVGGGLYAATGQLSLRHCVFAQNSGTSSGGAVVVSSVPSGDIIGNTFDGNVSPSVGGLLIGASGLQVFNNIVSNSAGTGISCGGTPPAVLTYNLTWNNSGGDYAGCAPGVGSLSSDPLFVNRPNGDYHLAIHSPAIDAGNPAPSYDDPDGSRGDVGTYGSHAFAMDQPSYPKNLNATVEPLHTILRWNGSPEPDVTHYAVYRSIDPYFAPSAETFVALVAVPDTTYDDGVPVVGMRYKVNAIDASGYAGGYGGPLEPAVTGTGNHVIPYAFRLDQNLPNPFNPSTTIHYELGSRAHVSMVVFDVRGEFVTTLVDGTAEPGTYTAHWDGTNANGEQVSTGVYFYRLTAGPFSETRKMILLK